MRIIMTFDTCCFQPESPPGSEDAISIASHIKVMQEEMKKAVPNLMIIDDRMNRTLRERRKFVKENLRVKVLEEYPALKIDIQVTATELQYAECYVDG
jgi:hypothetical protein